MQGRIPPIKLSKLLIVGGRDEENFFTAALNNHLGITAIQVLPIGGKTLLTASLNALKIDPAFPTVQCVAVVRDADLTPGGSANTAAFSAFDSVRSALTAPMVRLPFPAGHGQFTNTNPRVGVFIMPDGAADGMLETLCMTAVATCPEHACVTDFFTCIQSHGVVTNNLDKAKAHAWLASRPEPDKRVGEAALANYWPFGDPAFQSLWKFLQSM